MLNKFTEFLAEIADQGAVMANRLKDKTTFRRIVYAAYLMGRADGSIDAEEKTALAKFIAKDFSHFKIQDIVNIIKQCDEKMEFDEILGEQEIMDEIARADKEAGEQILRLVCYIGSSDGNFDEDEKALARKIATLVQVEPTRYGL